MYISKDLATWQTLLDFLERASHEDKLNETLTLLLTPDERDTLSLRLQIIGKLLEKNASQREIQQELKTSVATITRGSNMIKSMSPAFLEWVSDSLKK